MSIETVARTNEEKLQMLVGAAHGVEPYHSFFLSVGERIMSGDRKVQWTARRDWFAFMRAHATDYLTRWPDTRDDLVEFMDHFLTRPRSLHASTRVDAEVVLSIAKNF